MRFRQLPPYVIIFLACIPTPQLFATPFSSASHSLIIEGTDPADITNGVHIGDAPPPSSGRFVASDEKKLKGSYAGKDQFAGGLNEATVIASAVAAPGTWGVKALADAAADDSLVVNSFASAITIDDSLRFTPPLLFPFLNGAGVTFNGNVELKGELTTFLAGTADIRVFSEIRADIGVKQDGAIKGSGVLAGSRAFRTDGALIVDLPPRTAQIHVTNLIIGEPFELEMLLTARASVQIDDTFRAGDLNGTGSSGAAFSNTLLWAGVTDAIIINNGEPMPEGYTIPSEWGFDYAQPFPVPEPSSFLLIATALAMLCSRRWRWHYARTGYALDTVTPPASGIGALTRKCS